MKIIEQILEKTWKGDDHSLSWAEASAASFSIQRLLRGFLERSQEGKLGL